MAESTSPPLPEIFVERILDYADGDALRPVTVRIYKPVQRGPEEWGCTVEFQGLRPEGRVARHELSGGDGVQALFGALRIAEVVIDRHKGNLSRGGCTLWEPVGFRDASETAL